MPIEPLEITLFSVKLVGSNWTVLILSPCNQKWLQIKSSKLVIFAIELNYNPRPN